MSAVSDLSYELPRQRAPDAAALACSLFTRHQRRIYRLCLIRLGSRQDAEDALQQTFVNALKALQAGVRPHAEAAWLLEIARNVCLERHRSSSRQALHEFAACPDDLDNLPSPSPPPADQALEVCAALDRLDPRQREALLLREWRGLSYREVAVALQLSQSAAEALLFRARRSLARALDDTKRLRGALNLGNLLASHRAFFSGAAAKTAAIVACCGVTVAAEPALQRAVTHLVHPPRAAATRSQQAGVGASSSGRRRHALVVAPRAEVKFERARAARAATPTAPHSSTGAPAATETAAAGGGDPTHTTSAPVAAGGAVVSAPVNGDSVGAGVGLGTHDSAQAQTSASANVSNPAADASAGVTAPDGTSATASANAAGDVVDASVQVTAPGGVSVGGSTTTSVPSIP